MTRMLFFANNLFRAHPSSHPAMFLIGRDRRRFEKKACNPGALGVRPQMPGEVDFHHNPCIISKTSQGTDRQKTVLDRLERAL